MRQVIDDVKFAVEEHIWGHRLYDEQLPHLAVLEFLCVLGSNAHQPLREVAGQKVRYRPQRQIRPVRPCGRDAEARDVHARYPPLPPPPRLLLL